MSLFTAAIKRFQEKATQRVSRTRRAVALELFNSVIADTPVRTGRAQGNWQASLDTPVAGTVERLGEHMAKAEAERVTLSAGPDSTIYLSNNLPYIVPLEYGHSQEQAPHGMVRKNMSRIEGILANKASQLP